MYVLRRFGEDQVAHVIVVCETCKTEIDILHCVRYESECERLGWTKENKYESDAKDGNKYKLFHWCPKCSLERTNKDEGVLK